MVLAKRSTQSETSLLLAALPSPTTPFSACHIRDTPREVVGPPLRTQNERRAYSPSSSRPSLGNLVTKGTEGRKVEGREGGKGRREGGGKGRKGANRVKRREERGES